MLRDLRERQAQRAQQELEDELEEAEFEREMEAIRTGNLISSRNSPVSSQFSESIVESSLGGSELGIDPLS
jgi:hypothetical protein